MKIHNEKALKRVYCSPLVTRIKLDNEISLALESNPAVGPNEEGVSMLSPECFKDSPFKTVAG